MEKRSCFREFSRYTTLSILGTLGVSCYILADTFFVSAGLGAKGLAALNLAIPGLRLFLMTYSCASREMTAVRSCQWRLCWLAVFQIFCLIISLSFHCIWGCLAQSLRLACHRSSVWYLWRRIGWNEKIHFTWSESGFAQIWRKRRLLWECLLW